MVDEEPPGAEVLVIGSINRDLSLGVERFPEAGETVIGIDVVRGGGGKGANQAVAAARLGRRVAMVGRVGDDDAGTQLRAMLQAEGVDTAMVGSTAGPTGLAVIEVDASGENRIVVISGANSTMTAQDLDPAADLIASAPVILVQLEIPIAVVEAVARSPRTGRLVLNPAPAAAGLDLGGVDILVPNRGELAALAGRSEPHSVDEVADQVKLLPAGPEAVVVTLGRDGALVVDRLRSGAPSVEQIPPVPVEAVDTTAAGDAFCGGLADALSVGADVGQAARWAARVAAVTVTRRGAQSSLPARSDVVA